MRPLCLVVLTACLVCGCAWQQLLPKPTRPSPEEQVEALVLTIDNDADPLHSDHTPSVHKLIEIGDPAIPRMLDLMLLDGRGEQYTRLHAKTVLWYIVLKKNGFNTGSGQRAWSDPEGLDRANALWKSLGNLDYEAPLAERERAVKLWREWLAKNKA